MLVSSLLCKQPCSLAHPAKSNRRPRAPILACSRLHSTCSLAASLRAVYAGLLIAVLGVSAVAAQSNQYGVGSASYAGSDAFPPDEKLQDTTAGVSSDILLSEYIDACCIMLSLDAQLKGTAYL